MIKDKNIIGKGLLEEVLTTAPNVKSVQWICKSNYGFSRDLEFYVHGKKYVIEWWVNGSYLYFNEGAMFSFDNVKVSGTWPNRFKTNLQFYQDGKVVAIIPLEQYSKKDA